MAIEFDGQPFDPLSGAGRAVSMAVFYEQVEASLHSDGQVDAYGWKESLETEAGDFLEWFDERAGQDAGYRPSATETAAHRLAQAVMKNVEGLPAGDALVRQLLGGVALQRGDDLRRALAWDGLKLPSVEEWEEQMAKEGEAA